ncbi:hypothetical protein B0H14DRAFT_2665001 [Mycena olivaceomarginata]|nr:hypothetical protein B0H14DRAFT_2665001 [Mycena olivaceomarginata]
MALPQRTLHDKTSYSILPTPPSPKRITSPSPSLSPSNSNSAASATATEPTTPPQSHGRARKHYPDGVGVGRVPLHRRGTSKTYERLEDLLREAGYKETRIFTPETERTVPHEETKSPIGAAFVGFLSHLVPSRSTSLKREEEPEVDVHRHSPPTPPPANPTPRPSASHATRNSVSHQQPRHNSNTATVVPRINSPTQRLSVRRGSKAADHSGALSTRRSVADMQPPQRQRVDSVVGPLPSDNHQMPPLHHPAPSRPVNRYYQHHPSSSRGSGISSPPPPLAVPPTPTRASTYLRHMTSFDRPQSTPPTYTRMMDDAEEESLLSPTLVPRMPTGWMDNVKRARDYFAPPLPPISASPPKATKLGRSVSAKTRGRLSDRTNANGNGAHAPPLLTARLSSTRAKRSESPADLDLRGQLELPDPEELNFELARSRFLSGWGTASASAQLLSPPRRRDASFDSGESDISSEGEEELTLARILVPSRHGGPAPMERSRSVRSLRRCLELDGHGQGQGEVPPVPPLPGAESKRWGRAHSGPVHSDAEDADEQLYVSVASGRGSTRQRGVMPSWGN